MAERERQGYVKWDSRWTPKECPICRQKPATAHGWIFEDPPPPSLALGDFRKPSQEVLPHEGGEDCVILAPAKS